ncbi:hypothetical protein [Alkalicoccus halolimnae]|uniref:Uncharacterized protein n=1 Tax=Alkalicoccus halolimnae TaxID=1667239 RepID=A0A5C7EZV8_9BACI|nr:hypothetical protein [Alkalicoccus halolimnae]TXF81989.1 hypothetical protein FTX54_15335 [Alkalicoccus halolimnae]
MNNLNEMTVVYIRRAFDWRGRSGIEFYTENSAAAFSEAFREVKMELNKMYPGQDFMFYVCPPMTKEEFHRINDDLLVWKKEVE